MSTIEKNYNNMIQGYPQPEKGKYKVYVNTITYNQSEYIVDTFNGVAMQQTNFPFVHCVYDDCSTDGEQDVIKRWLAENCQMDNAVWYDNELAEIVEVEHNTNPYLTVVVYFFKRNLYKEPSVKSTQFTPWQEACEYEALCEGDDYWIAPDKLQKQVDFLDVNLEYSYTWTNALTIKKGKICRPYNRYKESCTPSSDDIIIRGGLWVPTASILVRSTICKSCPKDSKFHVGDYVLQIWGAYKGKNYYFSEPMCVYRIGSIGSWANRMKKLSEKDKISIIEKEHYLLQQMNRHTNGVFSDIFNQRWHLYAFREFKAIKDFEKAKSHWHQLYPKYRKGIENRCFVNRYFFIAKFIGKFRRLRVKIADYKFRISSDRTHSAL